ncbi:Lebercilin-like protein [Pseudolycoriella hygida]|uniref:Lebercilin-like protein n=1 Tax=Pseudolycoriella hygida TaxID=35572 RepID=A0A9Q0N2X4_9DIPT|nr:Lebercilin-like protein [Pseudolycoriella hygida]
MAFIFCLFLYFKSSALKLIRFIRLTCRRRCPSTTRETRLQCEFATTRNLSIFHLASSKSLESFQSSASCCPREYSSLQMYKKQARTLDPTSIRKTVSEVRQRVASARVNRLRSLQNQLNDAHSHIGELINENRLLRTIHKRQDSALQRYEGTGAELPQLLNSHAEEVRMWQIRCRNLQSQNRELGNKLKQKDTMLLSLTDHNRHLSQLNIDKNLEERDKLSERVRNLEMQLAEKDDELKVLHRRLQLDAKSFKQQISNGNNKQKELMQKLDKANAEILRIGEIIRTESMISPSKMSLGTYLRSNKLNSTIAGKVNLKPKNSETSDRLTNGGSDSIKKDKCANRSPTISLNSSKVVARNSSQQSNDAFPLVKSYVNDKSNRLKPSSLSTKIKNSMMDFTDIKYPTTNAGKPFLKNSSSMDSSETVQSLTQYDDDGFDTSSTTQETNELNNHSDTVESIDDAVIGDHSFEKYQTYSDQRNVADVERNNDAMHEIEELRKNVQDEIVENESFLDRFCESLSNDVKIASKDLKPLKEVTVSKDVKTGAEKTRVPIRANIKGKESSATKKGRVGSGATKKNRLDPTKKIELLEQLKAIDGAE